jgi:hypothetical protein
VRKSECVVITQRSAQELCARVYKRTTLIFFCSVRRVESKRNIWTPNRPNFTRVYEFLRARPLGANKSQRSHGNYMTRKAPSCTRVNKCCQRRNHKEEAKHENTSHLPSRPSVSPVRPVPSFITSPSVGRRPLNTSFSPFLSHFMHLPYTRRWSNR